jgi:hypothetical protein
MLQTSSLLADSLADRLVSTFVRSYGKAAPTPYAEILGEAARLVIERLSLSDALYHSAEHTALVTLVAQDILRGLRFTADVPPDMWLHVVMAALAHDIGYLRGICRADTEHRFVANTQGDMIELPRGASDAALAPWHVDRSKIFVRERFVSNPLIEPERLARNIELTRFPVPDGGDHAETDTEAGFVRAADLIGQLGDPLYPRKLNALFHEFGEIGVNKLLNYATPADVADHYPRFFWSKVEPFIGAAVQALNMTAEGRLWLTNLYSHVFVIEHGRRAMGPNPARVSDGAGPVVRDLAPPARRSG